MTKTIYSVFANTNWELLAEQKLRLIKTIRIAHDFCAEEELTGMLHFIDAVQDGAEKTGFPVVWLTEDNVNNTPEQA